MRDRLNFYPRPPRGGRQGYLHTIFIAGKISIHALREEGDMKFFYNLLDGFEISIHALREEGDHPRRDSEDRGFSISIHALREEGDLERGLCIRGTCAFLSTPSARRATTTTTSYRHCRRFLSTPSARRATSHQFLCDFWFNISIHALREEGDQILFGAKSASARFLSTPSARRATYTGALPEPQKGISIHALREEGDSGRCGRLPDP